MIFVPSTFGSHDYAAMLDRVTAQMASPPEVVVVRGDAGQPHAVRVAVQPTTGAAALPVLESRRGADDPLHLRHHGAAERRSAHP